MSHQPLSPLSSSSDEPTSPTSFNNPSIFNNKVTGRKRFTPDEDSLLVNLVSRYGQDWVRISEEMGTRTTRQCRERWRFFLSPDVDLNEWTATEDALLLEKYAEHGPRWKKLQLFFPKRTYINIRNHYRNLQNVEKRKSAIHPNQIQRAQTGSTAKNSKVLSNPVHSNIQSDIQKLQNSVPPNIHSNIPIIQLGMQNSFQNLAVCKTDNLNNPSICNMNATVPNSIQIHQPNISNLNNFHHSNNFNSSPNFVDYNAYQSFSHNNVLPNQIHQNYLFNTVNQYEIPNNYYVENHVYSEPWTHSYNPVNQNNSTVTKPMIMSNDGKVTAAKDIKMTLGKEKERIQFPHIWDILPSNMIDSPSII
ncbi:hypothetical protein TRFO_28279 [Tritrichomonas foetus]|uniref:Myb-like DNA-binding domain containing protein n=1 Tax=Tritrichomonas foetus TaxID=1144522 RepID=A0A1J4K3G3_9EUKA|nr:hypothetical protein TRFO_28279 [Tritrichomonas foetus]|eukprot:OHT04284.1 hypothetical protein TRFO_28279 [Tritrichomonas foetus]